MPRFPLALHVTYVIFVGLEQVSLVWLLDGFSSPLTATSLTIPRGLLIVIFGTRLKTGLDDRAFGSLALAFGLGAALLVYADRQSWSNLWGHQRSESASPRLRTLGLVSLFPLVALIASNSPLASHLMTIIRSPPILPLILPHRKTIDLVFSYYDEPIDKFAEDVNTLLSIPSIAYRDPRIIVYVKTPNMTEDNRNFLGQRIGADEVFTLPNVGREGGTYLHHILRNHGYDRDPHGWKNGRPSGLADHVTFAQGHLAWRPMSVDRLHLLTNQTGYLHFAPYIPSNCGVDLDNNLTFVKM